MENEIKILILEHDPNDLELLQYALKKSGLQFIYEVVQTEVSFENALLNFKPAIILSNFSLPSFNGFSAFLIKEKLLPETPFLIVSGTIGDENAVELIKRGVTDYVLKEKLYQLGPKITRALNEAEARKQKEETSGLLQQREEQLQKVMNLSLDIIYTVDQNGNFVTINPAAKLILDYHPEELVGRNVIDFIHEEDKQKTIAVLANLKYGIDIINHETRFLRKSGITVTLLWSLRWHSDDLGYGVAKDISEVKKAEEKIKTSEKRFRKLLQNSTDGLTLVAEDDTVIERSPSALKILELNPEQVGNTFRLDLVHPDDFFTIEKTFTEIKNTPEIVKTVEYRMHMPDGRYKWLETTFHNQLNEDAVKAIVLNFRDITARKLAENALKKSELIMKKAQEIAHLGSWHEDQYTGKSYWSEETFRILGLLPGEVIPSKEMYLSFVHPEDRLLVLSNAEASENDFEGRSTYHRIIRKDGTIRHIYSDNKYEYAPGTRELMLYGVLLDVTNQKLIEEKLLHSESRLNEAQAIGKMGNWEVNFIDGSSEWSDEIYRIYGLEKGNFKPTPETIVSFVHPEERAEVVKKVSDSQATLSSGAIGFRFFRTTGELSYGYSEWRFNSDANGKPTSIFGILQDVTDIKLAELALEQSEEKYRSIFQLSPLPMWVFDVETYRFLNVNEAAIRHYGYNKEEFLNMTIKDIRPEKEIETLEETINTNKKTGVFYQSEANHKKKNGELIAVDIQSNLIDYEGKNARLVLAIDISEKTKYIQAIEAQNKKLREIAWIQSHVVRAPLARIMGLVSLLQDNPNKGENFPELVGYLTSSARELDVVIRDIIKETENVEKSGLE